MTSTRPALSNLALQQVPYSAAWLDALIPMWRASFEAGVGVTDPHPLQEQRQFFLDAVLPQYEVQLALSAGQLVGFIAASAESVNQLYVRVDCQRLGVGSLLLDWAKAQSAGSLWLYTFQQNAVARAFYERHGFEVLEEGFEPTWGLKDLKYGWRRSTGPAAQACP
ncbi:GNAT family N-acetyltransferase [Inhella proteolytica]|uniref:GNAT family N-acetyltransferase n=1 Tax=Inhella proteolytica TaxID=2795029 RepID=A0A931J3Z9_9BURK|nr:GNAT family N-acetyltransferase [Inhella proteolytica]MBH9579189.1 GNAT family N-acetyltransferase [Inhella proteolytica]